MSSEEPIRQVPDELFRKVSAKPERTLPDALFGPPPRPASSETATVDTADEGDDGTEGDEQADSDEGSEPGDGGRHPPGAVEGAGGDTGGPVVDIAERAGESSAGTAASVEYAVGVSAPPEPVGAVDETSDAGRAVTVGTAPEQESELVADTVSNPKSGPDAEPNSSDESTPRRPVLLVIADSLAYFGPKGGLPADHPRIWPNLVAAELDWEVELVARIGWTCRDAYWALIGDPRIWAAVPHAGAVVFAVGGMDTLPSPLPTALREQIRYIRPPGLRRVVRSSYQWLQPRLSKLGWPVALPPKVSIDYLEKSRAALAQLRPDLPVVAVLPSVHDCAAYGGVHRGRDAAVRALEAWSTRTDVPLVDLAEAVRDNVFSGESNPDGIHWGWAGHTAVANAMVKTLQEVG